MQKEQNTLDESFKMEEVEGKTPAELLTLGMKAFWATNYKHAVQYLGKSSELLVDQHKDDKHDSLAEVYLFYGKTLLELSREEGDPLGEAVPKEVPMEEEEESGDDDNNDGEENESITEKKADESESTEKSKTDDEKVQGDKSSKPSEAAEKTPEKKKDCENKSDDAKVSDKTEIKINGENASSNSVQEKGDDKEAKEDEEEEGEEDGSEEGEDAGEGTSGEKAEEDEPTDLQLAWQVLELARLILERRGDAAKAEYADCLITLGEVSLENEVFDSAITDIKTGLEIQQQLYKNDASKQRRLAETCYKLGLAHSTNNQIEDGVKCYEECLELLKKRIAAIERSETEQDKKELGDITALIPEIEEKIVDLKTYKEEAAKSLEAAKEPATFASPEKKATDISHLVKRKRKLDEATTSEETLAKKPSPWDPR